MAVGDGGQGGGGRKGVLGAGIYDFLEEAKCLLIYLVIRNEWTGSGPFFDVLIAGNTTPTMMDPRLKTTHSSLSCTRYTLEFY